MAELKQIVLDLPPEDWLGVYDAVPVPMWFALDSSCERIVGNRAAQAVLSSGREENVSVSQAGMPQRRFREYVNGKPATEDDVPIHRAVRSGEAVHGQRVEIRFDDGSIRHLVGSGYPVRRRDGTLVGGIAAMVDVTELRETEASRNQEAQRSHLAMEAVRGVTYEWSGLGGPSFDVDALVALIGDRLQTERAFREWLRRVHPDDRYPYGAALRRFGRGSSRRFVCEYRVLRSDGSWRHVVDRAIRLEGSPRRVVGFLLDTTEQKRIEEDLRRFNADLDAEVTRRSEALVEAQRRLGDAERLASLGTLAAGVAHEINNPLSVIRLNAELIEISLEDEEDKESIQEILEASDRIAAIVRQVLQLGREDEPDREAEDIVPTLRRAADYVGSMNVIEGDRLVLDLGVARAVVRHSPVAIEQVLVNLVKNAFEAGAERVHIGCNVVEGSLVLLVEDDGPGIAEGMLRSVFDPFVSTKRGKGGTGLGMAVSRSIVKSHGGSIRVANRDEGGARFTIRLPLVEGA